MPMASLPGLFRTKVGSMEDTQYLTFRSGPEAAPGPP